MLLKYLCSAAHSILALHLVESGCVDLLPDQDEILTDIPLVLWLGGLNGTCGGYQ